MLHTPKAMATVPNFNFERPIAITVASDILVGLKVVCFNTDRSAGISLTLVIVFTVSRCVICEHFKYLDQ